LRRSGHRLRQRGTGSSARAATYGLPGSELSAWELVCHALPTTVFAAQGLSALSVIVRYAPSETVLSGTQRARRIFYDSGTVAYARAQLGPLDTELSTGDRRVRGAITVMLIVWWLNKHVPSMCPLVVMAWLTAPEGDRPVGPCLVLVVRRTLDANYRRARRVPRSLGRLAVGFSLAMVRRPAGLLGCTVWPDSGSLARPLGGAAVDSCLDQRVYRAV